MHVGRLDRPAPKRISTGFPGLTQEVRSMANSARMDDFPLLRTRAR